MRPLAAGWHGEAFFPIEGLQRLACSKQGQSQEVLDRRLQAGEHLRWVVAWSQDALVP